MDTEIFVVAIVFFSVVAIVKIVAETNFRKRLLDKGLADESVRKMYGTSARLQSMSSLKWGMVMVGLGAALLIGQLFPRYINDQVTFGLMFVFAGVGFLVYYGLVLVSSKKDDDNNNSIT